jgi:hypothetical protein
VVRRPPSPSRLSDRNCLICELSACGFFYCLPATRISHYSVESRAKRLAHHQHLLLRTTIQTWLYARQDVAHHGSYLPRAISLHHCSGSGKASLRHLHYAVSCCRVPMQKLSNGHGQTYHSEHSASAPGNTTTRACPNTQLLASTLQDFPFRCCQIDGCEAARTTVCG